MLLAAVGGVALSPPAAFGQSNSLPDISSQGVPTREELSPEQRVPSPAASPSRLTVDGDIERAPCPLAEPAYANVTMSFADVRFNGLSVVDPAMLRDSWEQDANRDVPIANVCTIRDRAATALRAMGYLAAVQVPPQRIEKGGTIQLDVLIAKLVAIEVRGDAGNSEKLIAAHLEALKGQPVFNIRDAERHLLLARDLPGYDVRLALRPAGTAPGEVIGTVQVTRQRVQVDVNIQNWGSKAVGRFGGLARVQINDLTGMGDSTTLALFNTFETREQTVLQAGHNFAIGGDGLRASGDLTYAWSQPDVLNGGLKSETMIVSAALSYPLLRAQTRNLSLSGGIDIIDQDVKALGVALTRDRLRVLFARLEGGVIDPSSLISTSGYSPVEPRWRLAGQVEARQGIAGLGASDRCGPAPTFAGCAPPNASLSRIDGDASAFVIRASAVAEFRPIPDITFSLAPRLQYSPNALLSFEEVSAGNYTVGRAYDPGTLTGDSGAGYSAELRYGSLMPKSVDDLTVQPFAFFDAMWVWNKNGQDSHLYSAGGGVRAQWGNHGRVDLTAGTPLRRVGGYDRGDWRVLLSITAQLLPWTR